MADTVSSRKRSAIMAAVKSAGNKSTELRMIQIFRANRILGWRRNQAVLGRPDFVFWSKRVAVFVDGCFWHGCAAHSRIPAANRTYWRAKILRNRVRDQQVTASLRGKGWRVVRVWEHSLLRQKQIARRIQRSLA